MQMGYSPENNGSWRTNISRSRLSENHVKIHGIRDINTWSTTPIFILKGVAALINLRRALSCRTLNRRSAHGIRARNQRSCWWTNRVKEIELNLHQENSKKLSLKSKPWLARQQKNHNKSWKMLTPSPLDLGQLLQVLQLIHKMSLPVSIWTVNSLGGVPIFTLVAYSLNKKTNIIIINNN